MYTVEIVGLQLGGGNAETHDMYCMCQILRGSTSEYYPIPTGVGLLGIGNLPISQQTIGGVPMKTLSLRSLYLWKHPLSEVDIAEESVAC